MDYEKGEEKKKERNCFYCICKKSKTKHFFLLLLCCPGNTLIMRSSVFPFLEYVLVHAKTSLNDRLNIFVLPSK